MFMALLNAILIFTAGSKLKSSIKNNIFDKANNKATHLLIYLQPAKFSRLSLIN